MIAPNDSPAPLGPTVGDEVVFTLVAGAAATLVAGALAVNWLWRHPAMTAAGAVVAVAALERRTRPARRRPSACPRAGRHPHPFHVGARP